MLSEKYDPGKFIQFQDDGKIKVTRQNVKKEGRVITLYVSHEQHEQITKLKEKMNCQTWDQWVEQLIIFFAGELS